MPTVEEFLERETFFDAAILRHGFTDYMRDCEVIVSGHDGPPRTDVHRYQFIGCVEARVETRVAADTFAKPFQMNSSMQVPSTRKAGPCLSGPDLREKRSPRQPLVR